MIRTNCWKKVLVLMAVGAMAWAGAAQAQTYSEDFESGYSLGQKIGTHSDWYDGGDGPTVTSGIGVVGSVGLSPANNIFNWVANSFNWSEVTKVIIRMDFQTDGSGHFDDDRCGWTINSGSVNSADFFGAQLDNPDGGIVTYWRNSSGSRVQTPIVAFGDLKASTWYRFRNEITKLTSTSARLDVSLVELDAAGNPTGTPITGTVEDTSVWPGGAPDNKYFTASNIWPAFKNYTTAAAPADNAFFEIVPAGPVPTVTLVSPADESLVKTTEVSFTCSATSEDGLQEATLYVSEVPVTVTFSGADDTDDAQLYATDDSATPEVEGPDTNAGTAATINVDGDNPHAHAVIKFLNVFGGGPGRVPLGTTIISATLKVNCSNLGNMMTLYRLKEDWAEGEVTWNERSSGVPWTNGGADGTGSNAGVALDGDCTATGWRTMDITQFVQEWSDGAANFGIVLTDSGGSDGVDFYSSESGTPPILTITYGSDFEPIEETQPMSGTEDTVTFGPITLADEQDYVWNCLVTNESSEQSWAPADFHLTVNTQCPDEPVVVQPTDDATDVSTSPELVVTVSDPQSDLMDVTFYGRGGASGEEFTIIVLPDTQKYVVNGAYPEIFTAQTQWIIDNKDALNIVFVIHEGDIVDTWNNETEWSYANASMSLLDGVVPYSVVPGDHDHEGEDPIGSTEYYEQYFPALRFTGYSWWGGSYDGNYGGGYNEDYPHTNNNNYQLLTIGGQNYIFLSLDFCPSQDEIDWANGVLTTYSERKAILTTHALLDGNADYKGSGDFWLYPDGTSNSTGDTSLIWYDLIRNHENLQLVLCGHMHEEARRTDNNLAGQPVHQLLANYQSRPNGGNGWLRIMRFVPAEDTVYVDTYSPWLDQYETDADSQFTLNLPMNYFEEIGTNTGVVSGTNASLVWSDLLLGKEYEWFVEVTDTAEHTQVGPIWSFTTIDNPQQASNPSPMNEATGVDIDADLSWTAGAGANTHDVYFGTSYTAVEEAFASIICPEYKGNQIGITFDPCALEEGVTYYWRIDEKNEAGTTTGTVWSFTTSISAPGMATLDNPLNGATGVGVAVVLRWFSGDRTASHDVYFGTSFDGVNDADNGSPEFQCNILQQYGVPVGDDVLFTWDPLGITGDLPYDSSYYWRIDEINPGGVTKGNIWSFITETDTYPPIFTYLWVNSTAHEATIGWTTNELSDSLVEYSLDTSYGQSVYDGNEVTLHSVTLTGLQPGKEYYYRMTSTDQAEPGNSATEPIPPSTRSFTTLANTAPVAVDDSATTNEGVAVVIDVLANDSDYDGDTLTVMSVTQGINGSVVDNGDGTVTYTPNGAAPYTDTFQYTINDGYEGTAEATVTVEVSEPYVDYTANSEIAILGTVTNDYTYTWESDNDYEAIEEAISGGGQPKNLRSSLEHKWTVDVVGGDIVTFYVEAYHTANSEGDDFVFAYSMDNVTYTDMLTVTKTTDDDTYQTYSLPSSISGTVYIRVQDTDDSRGNGLPDMIYVDHMFIRRTIIVAPPGQASNPNPANGAEDVAVSVDLSWTAGTGAESHNVWFGTGPGSLSLVSEGQTETSYNPGTLANEVTYFWRIDGINGFGITTGDVWSFTTKPAGGVDEVYVESISMGLESAGRNWKGVANVQISVYQANATVVGDWYLNDQLIVTGSTGITDSSGYAVNTSPPEKPKSGDTFTFEVTDIILGGYIYSPNDNLETQDSITVP